MALQRAVLREGSPRTRIIGEGWLTLVRSPAQRQDVAMSIMRLAGAVALFVLLGTPAGAAEPLQPTDKWNVDFGDAHCIAMRTYGPPDKPIILAFKPSPIGDLVQLSVMSVSGSKAIGQYSGTLAIDGSSPVDVSIWAIRQKPAISACMP